MRYLIITLMSLSFAFAGDAKPLPADAQKAVDAMEVQINKARQECLKKLNVVIMDITKTGNLEAAMVVKAKETEIMDAMPHVDLFGDSDKAAIVGKWSGGAWWHEYNADGTVKLHNGNMGKWVIKGNKLLVTWANGSVDTFFMPIKNNTLSGSNHNGVAVTMTKVVAK